MSDVRYIAKPDTWFKAGTEARLLDDCSMPGAQPMGLFYGLRVCEIPGAEGGRTLGEEYMDEEICTFDEFEEVRDGR